MLTTILQGTLLPFIGTSLGAAMVFLLKRQQLDRRCPNCGTRGTPFRMPYSGVHETLRQRAGNLEE